MLALTAALLWGVTDFVGGAMSRRVSGFQVGVAELIASAVCIAPLAFWAGGDPTPADFGWGAAAGVLGGTATGFFYRGLAHGRMGVVAPVSAVGTALVPVVVGLATGERPSPLALAGVAIAFPGIWLLSSTAEQDCEPGAGTGLADASIAGGVYGLMFVCMDHIGHGAGLSPLVILEIATVPGMILAALMARESWLPRTGYPWRAAWLGPIVAIALAAFQIALRHGFLTIVAVIGALYPASTVLLAVALLRERVLARQGIGLVLAGVAVALVAVG